MNTTEPWKGTYKVGGGLLIAAGLLYFANLALVISQGGAIPTGGANILGFVARISFVVQASSIVFLAIDAMLVLAFVALFLALRGANRTYATIGGALALVALPIDLVNTEFFYSLVGLSQSYSASTNDVARASYAAIAEFAGGLSAGIGESLFFTLLSVAVVAMSAAMLAERSWKVPGYLGMVAGVLGVVAGISGFVPLIILWPAWFVVTGIKLLRWSRSSANAQAEQVHSNV